MRHISGDSTLRFLRDGYLFGTKLFTDPSRGAPTDAFQTRLALLPMTVVRGASAADMFYNGGRFTRGGAMPPSVVHLLQDNGSVQTLDGTDHHHRKSLFLTLLTDPAQLNRMRELFTQEWQKAVSSWRGEVVLQDELVRILTLTGMRWAGIDPQGADVGERASELGAMVEQAGSIGPANWIAQLRRLRTERWAAGLIEKARDEQADTPLADVAGWRDREGDLLDVDAAVVELLNLLRPIVAVSRFMVFAALLLHQQPRWAQTFRSGEEEDLEGFVHEVRRISPFFPVIAGRATRDVEWQDARFAPGDRVLLDLYATNHHPGIWEHPHQFRPQRFRDWDGDPNTLIPQGAGDAATGHRCPGEKATIELLKQSVLELVGTDYRVVPGQDLQVSLRRFPALPASGFVIDRARVS